MNGNLLIWKHISKAHGRIIVNIWTQTFASVECSWFWLCGWFLSSSILKIEINFSIIPAITIVSAILNTITPHSQKKWDFHHNSRTVSPTSPIYQKIVLLYKMQWIRLFKTRWTNWRILRDIVWGMPNFEILSHEFRLVLFREQIFGTIFFSCYPLASIYPSVRHYLHMYLFVYSQRRV